MYLFSSYVNLFLRLSVNSKSFTVPSNVSCPFLMRFQAPNDFVEGENEAHKDFITVFIPNMSNKSCSLCTKQKP